MEAEDLIGQPAPAWQLSDAQGGVSRLTDFLGRPLLVLFFSIDCPACVGRALPFSRLVAARYPALRIVGIHSQLEGGRAHTPEQVRAVAERQQFSHPVLLDDGGTTFSAYGASGTPHWVLIDAQGIVRKSFWGSTQGPQQRLEYALQEHFSGAHPVQPP